MSKEKVTAHEYERSPHSGAGNCWCGRGKEDTLHPHVFTPARVNPLLCVCSKSSNWHRHVRDGNSDEAR